MFNTINRYKLRKTRVAVSSFPVAPPQWLVLLVAILSFISSSVWAQVTQTDNLLLQELLDSGVPVVDIRTESEWKSTGIIEGSHTLAFFDEKGRYDVNKWMGKLSRIAKPGQPVVLICAVGGRTANITHFLTTKTEYKSVYNVTKGIDYWIKNGGVVVPYEQ